MCKLITETSLVAHLGFNLFKLLREPPALKPIGLLSLQLLCVWYCGSHRCRPIHGTSQRPVESERPHKMVRSSDYRLVMLGYLICDQRFSICIAIICHLLLKSSIATFYENMHCVGQQLDNVF